ncbi:hypothetical protein AX660_19750 [Paraglaciecola hydrolytica]|uniref:Uncharacterized protein n=1 Tax=Paraglaciecola hydrolytica TaxID=1799789 RepID=A0A148KNA0_9ALTE|nr:hypothetical protein AX660_19750 [Paraglaciecola hydrolytica]
MPFILETASLLTVLIRFIKQKLKPKSRLILLAANCLNCCLEISFEQRDCSCLLGDITQSKI